MTCQLSKLDTKWKTNPMSKINATLVKDSEKHEHLWLRWKISICNKWHFEKLNWWSMTHLWLTMTKVSTQQTKSPLLSTLATLALPINVWSTIKNSLFVSEATASEKQLTLCCTSIILCSLGRRKKWIILWQQTMQWANEPQKMNRNSMLRNHPWKGSMSWCNKKRLVIWQTKKMELTNCFFLSVADGCTSTSQQQENLFQTEQQAHQGENKAWML